MKLGEPANRLSRLAAGPEVDGRPEELVLGPAARRFLSFPQSGHPPMVECSLFTATTDQNSTAADTWSHPHNLSLRESAFARSRCRTYVLKEFLR